MQSFYCPVYLPRWLPTTFIARALPILARAGNEKKKQKYFGLTPGRGVLGWTILFHAPQIWFYPNPLLDTDSARHGRMISRAEL